MKRVLATIALVAYLVLFPAFGHSDQARIKNTLITNNNRDLLVHFYVDGSFTPKIEEAIQSGIPTTFIYRMVLYRKSDENLGQKIVARDISHTIKYDTLKKEYTVTMSEKREPVVTQEYKAARESMAKVEALSLIPLDRLQKESQYSLQIKAELDTIKLPPLLNYLFFFVSFWDFETTWEKVEFIY